MPRRISSLFSSGATRVMMRDAKRWHRGLTLVELLVVIAIIGVLVALLVPAVQAAREAARRAQCKNQLRQLALAAITHEETHGHYPTGGWTESWVGDRDRGFGREQPGGWVYNVLPFLEEQSLYDLPVDGMPDVIGHEQRILGGKLIEAVLPILYCPSRRAAIAYPFEVWYSRPANFFAPKTAGKQDYAINSGDGVAGNRNVAGPQRLEEASGFPWCYTKTGTYDPDCRAGVPPSPLTGERGLHGISFQGSEVGVKHVTDGTSNTYLVGEKSVPPSHYESHETGSNDAWCAGFGPSGTRGHHVPPARDADEGARSGPYGSPHASGCHMAYCDGRVRVVSYDIDIIVNQATGNRHDGMVIAAQR